MNCMTRYILFCAYVLLYPFVGCIGKYESRTTVCMRYVLYLVKEVPYIHSHCRAKLCQIRLQAFRIYKRIVIHEKIPIVLESHIFKKLNIFVYTTRIVVFRIPTIYIPLFFRPRQIVAIVRRYVRKASCVQPLYICGNIVFASQNDITYCRCSCVPTLPILFHTSITTRTSFVRGSNCVWRLGTGHANKSSTSRWDQPNVDASGKKYEMLYYMVQYDIVFTNFVLVLIDIALCSVEFQDRQPFGWRSKGRSQANTNLGTNVITHI